MYMETEAYDNLMLVICAAPFVVAVLLYAYIARKQYKTAKGLVLFFVCVALFFTSVYLFARGDDIFPAVKLWIVEKNDEGFFKEEKISLFENPFTFADNSRKMIRPENRYALVNNTDTTLIVEPVSYTKGTAIFNPSESQRTRTVAPWSTGYFQKLDFFGPNGPPDIIEITHRASDGSAWSLSEVCYWVRW